MSISGPTYWHSITAGVRVWMRAASIHGHQASVDANGLGSRYQPTSKPGIRSTYIERRPGTQSDIHTRRTRTRLPALGGVSTFAGVGMMQMLRSSRKRSARPSCEPMELDDATWQPLPLSRGVRKPAGQAFDSVFQSDLTVSARVRAQGQGRLSDTKSLSTPFLSLIAFLFPLGGLRGLRPAGCCQP